MSRLNVTEYLCHKWARICRNHNKSLLVKLKYLQSSWWFWYRIYVSKTTTAFVQFVSVTSSFTRSRRITGFLMRVTRYVLLRTVYTSNVTVLVRFMLLFL